MSSYNYFDWLNDSHTCACGWTSAAEDLNVEPFRELFEYFCSKCGARLGVMSYPTVSEIRTAAAKGDCAAKEMLEQVTEQDSYNDRVVKSRIETVQQLKDVPDETVRIRLVVNELESETHLIIFANDIEIGREPCFFESYEPASRLLAILEKKFGNRLRSIDWSRARLYLCGDRTSYVGVVSEIFRNYSPE